MNLIDTKAAYLADRAAWFEARLAYHLANCPF